MPKLLLDKARKSSEDLLRYGQRQVANMDSEQMKNAVKVSYGKLPYKADLEPILLASMDRYGDKKLKLIGTAFPFLCGRWIGLITAAHVINNLSGNPIVAIMGPKRLYVQNAQIIFLKEIDVAVIQCSSEDLNSLFDECLCIEPDIDRASNEESGTNAIYQVYGYPKSKNKFSRLEIMNPSIYRITLGLHKNRPIGTKLAKEFPLMCFDLGIQNMVDDEFDKTLQLGCFEGMSGGPVIRHKISSHDSDGQLVGMLVEWHNKEKTAVVIPAVVIAAMISVHILGTSSFQEAKNCFNPQ